MTGKELIRTYHDEDCPKCGFPETIDLRDQETMKLVGRECSKGCGWKINIKQEEQIKGFSKAYKIIKSMGFEKYFCLPKTTWKEAYIRFKYDSKLQDKNSIEKLESNVKNVLKKGAEELNALFDKKMNQKTDLCIDQLDPKVENRIRLLAKGEKKW